MYVSGSEISVGCLTRGQSSRAKKKRSKTLCVLDSPTSKAEESTVARSHDQSVRFPNRDLTMHRCNYVCGYACAPQTTQITNYLQQRQRNKPDTEMVGGPADAGVCIVQLCMYQEVMSISRRLVGCIVERSL